MTYTTGVRCLEPGDQFIIRPPWWDRRLSVRCTIHRIPADDLKGCEVSKEEAVVISVLEL